jgi:uncharacterized protein with PQ loop repeat
MNIVDLADLAQSITIVLSLTAYIPQWITMAKNKSSENISLSTWMLWFSSASMSWFYAFVQYTAKGNCFMLLASTTISVSLIVVTMYLIHKYRKDAPSNLVEVTA